MLRRSSRAPAPARIGGAAVPRLLSVTDASGLAYGVFGLSNCLGCAAAVEAELDESLAAFLPEAGGLADIACAAAALTAPVPRELSAELASVIPSNSVTAHLAMTTVSRIAPGESTLIHAGVGGLGSQFAQVARMLGAGRVDAVVGTPAKQQAALDMGYVNAYLRDDIEAIPDGEYDIVIDPVGGAAVTHGFRVLRSGGRLIKIGNASQADDVLVSSLAHWYENKTTAGFSVGAWSSAHPEQYTRSLRWALDAVTSGDLQVELSRVGTWCEAPDFVESLRIGETTGKLAVSVGGRVPRPRARLGRW